APVLRLRFWRARNQSMTVTKRRATRAAAISSSHLRFPQKCARLKDRLRDREWRRYGAQLFLGKMLGLALLLGAIFVLPKVPDILFGGSMAYGQQSATAPADPYASIKISDHVNALNTVWTLV